MKCEICGLELKNKTELKKHITRQHKIKFPDYLGLKRDICKIPECCNFVSWNVKLECYNQFCKEHNKKFTSVRCKEYWIYIKGLTEDEAKKQVSFIQSNSFDKLVKKVGIEEAKRQREEKRIKQTYSKSLEYYLEKYGEEGKELYKKYKENEKKQRSVEVLKEKWGEEKWNEVQNKKSKNSKKRVEWWLKRGFTEEEAKIEITKISKESSKRCKEYWIKKGFSEEEAIQKVSDSQRFFSKEICIQKYGEEEGLKIWQERQDKWQETLMNKDDYDDIVASRMTWFGYSKTSQLFFNELLNNLGYSEKIYFKEFNKEFMKYDKNNKICYFYDFVDTKNKKCIEYNGDLWHANPKIYSEDDTPNPFDKTLKAKEIWDKDFKKISFLESKGFEVLVIWESEVKNNKNYILNRCLDFLTTKER